MDFATILSPAFSFDWAVVNGDLAVDGGLDTAVAISLWSNRVLSPDDVPSGPGGDLGGWWGDAFLPPLSNGQPDYIGSKLWRWARALQTLQTAQGMQGDTQQALQWMEDDGVVASVTVPLPTFPRQGMVKILAILAQQTAAGTTVNRQYTSMWNTTRGTVSMSGIVVGGL